MIGGLIFFFYDLLCLLAEYCFYYFTVCNNVQEKPFLCMDMVFISTLLTKGYGFEHDAVVEVKLLKVEA